MKRILVHVTKANRLCIEEALNAAMVLASFDNHVSVLISPSLKPQCTEPSGKLSKLIQSFEFYEIEPPVYSEQLPSEAEFDHLLHL